LNMDILPQSAGKKVKVFLNSDSVKILKVNSTVRLCGGINSCISRV